MNNKKKVKKCSCYSCWEPLNEMDICELGSKTYCVACWEIKKTNR